MSSGLRRVVVTGLGLVTPLGTGVDFVWNRLLNGVSGIVTLNTSEGFSSTYSRVAGLVPTGTHEGVFNENSTINDPKEMRRLSRFMCYGLEAAVQALNDAGWKPENEADACETGVCFGSGIGGLGDSEREIHSYWQGNTKKTPSPYFILKTLVNIGAGHISQKLGLKGPSHSASTACTTGAHSIGDAMRFIQLGDANVMISGSGEASVTPLIVSAFSRVKALSTGYNNQPSKSSRPFDAKRDGFVIGEGAGCLVLEDLHHALNRGAKIYAEIVGYGPSSDAYHVTQPAPSGSGAIRSMSRAISSANISHEDVDYINAHATGTIHGDAAELKAISALFKNRPSLNVSSTKGSTGHLLGAAGTIESIFTILSVYNDVIPPMINLDNPIIQGNHNINLVGKEALYLSKSKEGKRKIDIALTNSFGFGGTNATLAFRKFNYTTL